MSKDLETFPLQRSIKIVTLYVDPYYLLKYKDHQLFIRPVSSQNFTSVVRFKIVVTELVYYLSRKKTSKIRDIKTEYLLKILNCLNF